jgi:hypothetical protein
MAQLNQKLHDITMILKERFRQEGDAGAARIKSKTPKATWGKGFELYII